jgi:hypothetical protein
MHATCLRSTWLCGCECVHTYKNKLKFIHAPRADAYNPDMFPEPYANKHTYTHTYAGKGPFARKPEYVFPKSNSYLRLMLMHTIKAYFPEIVITTRAVRGDDKEIVCMRSEVYKDTARKQKVHASAQLRLKERMGFRNLFKLLSESGKKVCRLLCVYACVCVCVRVHPLAYSMVK